MRTIYLNEELLQNFKVEPDESNQSVENYDWVFDAMPEYFSTIPNEKSIRFDLSILKSYAIIAFKPEKDVEESLIHTDVFGDCIVSSTHFTERSGWPCYQLAYTYHGGAVLRAEGKTYTVKPGTFFLIDCMPEHAFYADSAEGWGYSLIHFSGPAMKVLYKQIAEHTCCFPNMQDSRAHDFYKRLFKIAEENPADFDIQVNLLMTRLLNDLFMNAQSALPDELPEWLSIVQSYIMSNYNMEITIEELAKMSYLSPGRFSHKFKEIMGIAPIEYQYNLRISSSKELLEHTSMSIQEISNAVGFGNVQNFQVKFKKSVGTSPSEYRKQIL